MARTRTPSGPYPVRIEAKIAYAGASLNAWRDEIVLDAVDPNRSWTRWSWITRDMVCLVAALLPAIACLMHGPWPWSVAVAVVMLVVTWAPLQARTPIPAPASALGIVAAASAGGCQPAAAAGVLALVLVFVTSTRPLTASAAMVVAGVGAVVWPWLVVVVVGVAVVVGVVVAARLPWRGVWVSVVGALPWAPLPVGVLSGPVAHAPSGLGWLLRVRLRAWGRGQELEAAAVAAGQGGARVREAGVKDAGAIGERRTALALLGLPRSWWVGHDLALPGADEANVDHVAVGPGGVVVADSKQFGSRRARARVWFDVGRGEVVVGRASGVVSLTRELRSLGWATGAIGQGLGAGAVGVMVVHNTDVQGGLNVAIEGGVIVHVVAADGLYGFIEGLGRGVEGVRVRELVRSGRDLVHADGSVVRMIRSLGRTGASAVPAWVTGAPACLVTLQGASQAFEVPVAEQEPGGPHPVVAVAEGLMDGHERRWDMMLRSQAVDGEQLAADLAQVRQGVGVDVVDSSAGEFSSVSMIAMTRACRAADGATFVWVTAPESWEIYQATGRVVPVATVSVDRLVMKERG